ncbi:MAG: hypothetical protein P3X24_010375, partial [bacterium]|nr:hypothetical protein [bacterium]
IAETTGGKVNPPPTEAFRPVAKEGRSIRDLWRTFLWLALALLLIDITLRRVVIPLTEWTELLRRLPEKLLGGGKARRPAPQPQATARLLGVKERVATRYTAAESAPASPKSTPTAPSQPAPKPTAPPAAPTDTTSRLLELKKRRSQ